MLNIIIKLIIPVLCQPVKGVLNLLLSVRQLGFPGCNPGVTYSNFTPQDRTGGSGVPQTTHTPNPTAETQKKTSFDHSIMIYSD